MTVQDLVKATEGHRIKVTGPDDGQCTAIAHYWEQLLGLPIVYGDAFQTYDNADPNLYDKTLNSPSNFPLPGAIIEWNGYGYGMGPHGLGPAGHTAVVVSADVTSFTSLDQNWPEGSTAHLEHHDYNGVKGWYYPKKLNQAPAPSPAAEPGKGGAPGMTWVEQTQIDAWLHGDDGIDHWKNDSYSKGVQINALQAQVTDLQNVVSSLQQQLSQSQTQVTSLSTQPEYLATYKPVPNPYSAQTKQPSFALDMTGSQGPMPVPVGTVVDVAGTFSDAGKDYVRSQLSVDAQNNPSDPLHGTFYGLPREAFDDVHAVNVVPMSNDDFQSLAAVRHDAKAMSVAAVFSPAIRLVGAISHHIPIKFQIKVKRSS